ncbi:general transcription factor 3C polypeptide 2 isoform X3 [Rissa tridactyla]|uniref:general transcription factor 3C polypeptide 2 isoform X3 n=1 Tax=Rissa tridactyla TaxID=75485 RepID=UPI0023BA5766|nr:general transcription factor 3C polypeptide 2 isoform X3 [Rissa tridactyla]
MASNAARGPRCRERSRRGRAGRGSVTTGRSRERESRDLPGETPPLGDVDALGRSEEGDEATKTQKKPARNQKQKNIPNDPNGPAPAETGAHGEPSRTSENGSVPPPKAPGKRGRKSKTEMLLLKLSQDLECPAPEPICVQKMLGSSEQASEGLETPPGGRPKRRAAKVALLYLQELAEELTSVYQPPAPTEGAQEPELARVQKKRQSRRRKEEETDSDDPAQDADFVPSKEVLLQAEEEEGSDAPLSEASEPELEALRGHGGKVASAGRSKPQCRGLAPNGFHNSIMAPVEKCSSLTCSLREQKYSQWEFPDWIPLAHKWTWLSESEAAPYLPAEEKSPLFSIQREGIEDDGVLYRVNRFNSLQPHAERLDVSFFVGGPVWAMEWCPSPEGSAAAQYVAVYCHGSMEETHSVAGLHGGPALLQLWGLGTLQQEPGSADSAALAYAIAADHGCIWDMKFCPSGAWELPTATRKPPQMSRLGLLAVAFSDGKVLLYSLPHPGALRRSKATQMGPSTSTLSARCSVLPRSRWALSRQGMPPSAASASASPGCRASPIITSQPVFMTALWPSGTCSPSPCCSACTSPTAPSSSTLSGASWPTTTRCGASSGARPIGSDRKIKFWDLRRLYEPINSIKRFLSTEVAWLLPYNGVTVAQDNCYASYGLCGIHYIDAGYLGFKAYFVAPRKGTVWSISGSDWLNTVAAGDITGELLAAVLPDLAVNPLNVKRSSDRRFPVYKADLLPGDGEPALPKTRHYREMVTKSYIRFRDTDLLQELPQPGAHAQDALAGGQGRAQPRPPAAGVPAQGAFQPQPGLARLAGVGRAGGHRAGALPGRAGLRHQPPAAPRVPCPLQLPLRGPARQPQPPREPPAAHRIAPGRGSSCCCHTHVPPAGARARGRLRQPGSGGAPWPFLVLLTPWGRDVCSWPSLERSGRVSPCSGSGRILLRCLV